MRVIVTNSAMMRELRHPIIILMRASWITMMISYTLWTQYAWRKFLSCTDRNFHCKIWSEIKLAKSIVHIGSKFSEGGLKSLKNLVWGPVFLLKIMVHDLNFCWKFGSMQNQNFWNQNFHKVFSAIFHMP